MRGDVLLISAMRSLFSAERKNISFKRRTYRSGQSFPFAVILATVARKIVLVLLLRCLGGVEQRMQGSHATSARGRRGM
jgi:hypothetical protein